MWRIQTTVGNRTVHTIAYHVVTRKLPVFERCCCGYLHWRGYMEEIECTRVQRPSVLCEYTPDSNKRTRNSSNIMLPTPVNRTCPVQHGPELAPCSQIFSTPTGGIFRCTNSSFVCGVVCVCVWEEGREEFIATHVPWLL